MQDLWQVHLQILLIISQKVFIKFNLKIVIVFLEYESVKDNFIKCKYLSCNKDYSNKFKEKLKEQFKNTFKFSNNVINKLNLLLRKGVYPYEYIDDWEKFNETKITEKEEIYSDLNMADITDVDYIHVKRVHQDFEIKNFVEYNNLYLKSGALFSADFFKNYRKNFWKIYHLDLVKFLLVPRLARQAALKITEVKFELLTDIDTLLMVEKRIRGGICHAIHQYAKANNK